MTGLEPVLFLHGGPGLSAIAERALYRDTLPVRWWDQPASIVLYADPFGALIESAEEELRQLARSTRRRVNLLAHSFGTQLACRLAARAPYLVNEMTLMAPVNDIADVFIRMADRLRVTSSMCAPLAEAAERSRRQGDYALFAKLSAYVVSFANFIDVYWGTGSERQRRWYIDLFTREALFDGNVFEVVVQSFWAGSAGFPAVPRSIPVHLVFGKQDVLLDVDAEAIVWQSRLKAVSCTVLEGGHFIHLEHSPEMWWPRAWTKLDRR